MNKYYIRNECSVCDFHGRMKGKSTTHESSVPQARGRFHELCFSLSSSHESRKPNIHFL